MLVLVLGLVQANFLLQVRKVDLALISMKELDTWMNAMDFALNLTIDKEYSVKLRLTLDGVMTSINA